LNIIYKGLTVGKCTNFSLTMCSFSYFETIQFITSSNYVFHSAYEYTDYYAWWHTLIYKDQHIIVCELLGHLDTHTKKNKAEIVIRLNLQKRCAWPYTCMCMLP